MNTFNDITTATVSIESDLNHLTANTRRVTAWANTRRVTAWANTWRVTAWANTRRVTFNERSENCLHDCNKENNHLPSTY